MPWRAASDGTTRHTPWTTLPRERRRNDSLHSDNLRAHPRTRSAVRTSVPWSTVLPLAVVLSFADGFWITSMRRRSAPAVPAGPFTTWWRESSVLVPLYVCAVLGALR